jgi:hypothetical protein
MSMNQSPANDMAASWMNRESTEAATSGVSRAQSHAWTLSLGAAELVTDQAGRSRTAPPFCFAGGEL